MSRSRDLPESFVAIRRTGGDEDMIKVTPARPTDEVKRLYCLFSISRDTICLMIQDSRPTDDYFLLENLRAYISGVKAPTNLSVTEIIETDESCSPTPAGNEMIRQIRESFGLIACNQAPAVV